MKKLGMVTGSVLSGAVFLLAFGQEVNITNPGPASSGSIELKLEITEDLSAGFLKSGIGNTNSRFKELLSTRIIQTISQGMDQVLPLCVMSSGEGYFEVTLVDMPGAEPVFAGEAWPIAVSLDGDKAGSVKYRAMKNDCNAGSAIPVTVHLNRPDSSEELGTIHGKINLLVKSE